MKLLRQEEVADMLDVSQATISRMCSSGDLPHIVLRAGRRKRVIRFRSEEVELWLRQRTHGGPESRGVTRKRSRIGNESATENKPVLEAHENKSESGHAHRMFSPMSEV